MLLAARYVLPVSAPHIENGAVLVDNGEITDIGTKDELASRHPSEEVRDYGLAALLPGFVDLHTHLEFSAFRGAVDDLPYTQWKLQVLEKEAALTEEDWSRSAYLGALETIQSGITCIADITDSGASIPAAADAGIRGVIYRELSTMQKSEVDACVAEALEDMEKWRDASIPGLVEIGIAPHSPYSCHPALFQRVAAVAVEHGLAVATHLAGSRDEFDFVKYGSSQLGQEFRERVGYSELTWLPTGVSPVRYLFQWDVLEVPRLLAVHCVQVDDVDIDILARTNASIAHCPRCNAKLGMGIAPLASFLSAGLCVGLGTDSPASNSTIDFFDEMRIGLLIHRAITGEAGFFTAEKFVRMATLGGASALGLEDRIGTLDVGKRADIIAVDLSHSHQVPTQDPYGALVHTANQEDVLMTMVDGRVLYEHGRCLSLDPEQVLPGIDDVRLRLKA